MEMTAVTLLAVTKVVARLRLFHFTIEPLMKFAPVMVRVVLGLPALICLGLKSVMRGRPLTELKALAMPGPQIDVLHVLPPGKALTVFCMIWLTCAGVALGMSDTTSDAIPATCGAAMLVP